MLRGYGDQFTLDEIVAQAPNSSRSSWTFANPDGTNPEASGRYSRWQISADQLSRYTGHALPSTVQASDTSSAIELRGLSALADLVYFIDAGSVTTSGSSDPVE